jgi:hypothetical protein
MANITAIAVTAVLIILYTFRKIETRFDLFVLWYSVMYYFRLTCIALHNFADQSCYPKCCPDAQSRRGWLRNCMASIAALASPLE